MKQASRKTYGYVCLVLCKEDIRELMRLFRKSFQDIEMCIDNIVIVDEQQLEQFSPTEQVKNLSIRGYYQPEVLADGSTQAVTQAVEVKMTQSAATLCVNRSVSNIGENEVILSIRSFLSNRVNRWHRPLIYLPFALMGVFNLSLLQTMLKQHYVITGNLWSITVIVFLVTALLIVFSFIFVARMLHLSPYVSIFPGAPMRPAKYGNRKVIGSFILALVFLFIVNTAYTLIWR